MKILVSVIPAAGHLNPLLAMGLELKARGHELMFATGRSKLASVEAAGFAARPVLEGICDSMEQLNAPIEQHMDTYNPISLHRHIRYLLQAVAQGADEFENMARQWNPDLILTDFSSPGGAATATRLGLPWVSVTQSPFCIRNHQGTPGFLGGFSKPRHFAHRLRDKAGNLLLDGVRSAFMLCHKQAWNRIGLRLNAPGGQDGLYSPFAIISTTAWEIEFARSWPRQLHMVGPVNYSDGTLLNEEFMHALQMHRTLGGKVVLITLGTHLEKAKKALLPKVFFLARSLPSVRFLFNLGGSPLDAAHALGTDKMTELPANLQITPYLNYPQVLGQVDAVVHPGSAGIMYQCFTAGVPAVAIPHANDQFDNAARVVAAGVGLRLDARHSTPEKLLAALQKILLTDARFTERAQQLKVVLAHYGGARQAALLIEQVGIARAPLYRPTANALALGPSTLQN